MSTSKTPLTATLALLISVSISTAIFALDNPPPNFDGKSPKTSQDQWARHLATKVEMTNSFGMKLVLIPPGKFLMGEPRGKKGESPQHEVLISKPFYLGKYEVTQREWIAVMNTKPWDRDIGNIRNGDDQPVTHVSWEDAQEFCKQLSQKESKTYRLPTEAEWEYSCRGGKQTSYHFGNNPKTLGLYALYSGNAKVDRVNRIQSDVVAVGQGKRNPFGLHDMYGNVEEWCSDWFDVDYYAESPRQDPQGPNTGTYHVIRGGAWNSGADGCRSAARHHGAVEPFDRSTGFRIVIQAGQ